MTRVHDVFESPLGVITMVAEDDELCGLYFDAQRHLPDTAAFGARSEARVLASVREQLAAYFQGGLREFDVPVRMRGTPFQQRVWEELRAIPYGETASYGELAARVGHPGAARAVGAANGRNPVGIIVPCHRVIGSAGKLVGYGGGLDRKRALLNLERGGLPL